MFADFPVTVSAVSQEDLYAKKKCFCFIKQFETDVKQVLFLQKEEEKASNFFLKVSVCCFV